MRESPEIKIARIEEILKRIESNFGHLPAIVAKHDTKFEIIERDQKWQKGIIFSLAAVVGAATSALVEYFRR